MSSDRNKKPTQTTVTKEDDAITPRELTPEEADRIRGGIRAGASQVVSAGMDGGMDGGMDS